MASIGEKENKRKAVSAYLIKNSKGERERKKERKKERGVGCVCVCVCVWGGGVALSQVVGRIG